MSDLLAELLAHAQPVFPPLPYGRPDGPVFGQYVLAMDRAHPRAARLGCWAGLFLRKVSG